MEGGQVEVRGWGDGGGGRGEVGGTPIPPVVLGFLLGEGADCHCPSLGHVQTGVRKIIGAREVLHRRRLPQEPGPLFRRLVGQGHDLLGSASGSLDNHFGEHFCRGRARRGGLSKKPTGRAMLCVMLQCKRVVAGGREGDRAGSA